jgi:hypothetical protein
VNSGTFLEPFPQIGEFAWNTRWAYRCTDERVLTINDAHPHETRHSPVGRNIIRDPIGLGFGANTDHATEVKEVLTFSKGGGSGVSVFGLNVPLAPADTDSFQVVPRLVLVPTGGRDPVPAVAPNATATAEAHSSVTMPMPEPITAPAMKEFLFAREGQIVGDDMEVARWAHGLPEAVKAAIRDGRLVVTITGHASTTGNERSNFRYYGTQRALWARRIMASAMSVREDVLHDGSDGDQDAPASDRRPGGVPSARERRVEIAFAVANPTTPATITAGSSASARTGQ